MQYVTNIWVFIQQPFSRTFIVSFFKFCYFVSDTTSDLLNSYVSNAAKYREILCIGIFIRMGGENGEGPRFSVNKKPPHSRNITSQNKILSVGNRIKVKYDDVAIN